MRLLAACLVILAMLVMPVLAHAARLEGVPTRAVPGTTLVIRWRGLPEHTEEVELELSLDGGRWVRISREHDVTVGAIAWRVPDFASGRARLRLRAGGRGSEAVVAHSSEFEIPGGTAGPRPSEASAAHWWTSFAPLRGGRGGLRSGDTPAQLAAAIAPTAAAMRDAVSIPPAPESRTLQLAPRDGNLPRPATASPNAPSFRSLRI